MTRVADVSFGRSKLMTGDTPSTSMPRAAMWVAMGSDAAPRARFRRLHRSSHDSSLEQAGFEPSVPRDTTNFKEAAVCHLFRADGRVGANEGRPVETMRAPKKPEIRRCVKRLTHRTGSERLFGALLSEVSGASAIRRAPCRDMTFGGAGSYPGSSLTNARARLASNLSE